MFLQINHRIKISRIIRNKNTALSGNYTPGIKRSSSQKKSCIDLLDTRLLEKQIQVFKPDVVYLGHTYPLSKALMPYLATQNIPLVYDEGGSGLINDWTEHGRWFRFTGEYKNRFALLNAIKPLVIRMVCAGSRGRIQPQWSWPENMQVFFNSQIKSTYHIREGSSCRVFPSDPFRN